MFADHVKQVYAQSQNLLSVFDQQTVETFGFTRPELLTLGGLALAEGDYQKAVRHSGLSQPLFASAFRSLETRGLIAAERDTDQSIVRVCLDGAERQFKLGLSDEALEAEAGQPADEHLFIGTRPLREQLLLLARSATTPARGVARVYTYVYGLKPDHRDYGLIGLITNLLGRDRAVGLLLEFAHKPMAHPLQELIPVARARAARFRPAEAPDQQRQNDYAAALERQAWEGRMQYWFSFGLSAETVSRWLKTDAELQQCQADFARWRAQWRNSLR